MTETQKPGAMDIDELRPSIPLLPEPDLTIRVTRSQFAGLAGVTKQTVSNWCKEGKITLGADGKLDPAQAMREVIENSDPGKLRARVLKQATASYGELRQRIADLERELEQANSHAEALRETRDDAARWAVADALDYVESDFSDAAAAHDAGRLREWLHCVIDLVVGGDESEADAADDELHPGLPDEIALAAALGGADKRALFDGIDGAPTGTNHDDGATEP